MAVVKADGYGHGMVPVAKALAAAGTAAFGVALMGEAVDLRRAGLEQMILHLGRFDPDQLGAYLEDDLRLSIHSRDDIAALVAYHAVHGGEFSAHLKVDTGMGRMGIPYEEAVEALEEIKRHPAILLEGIYAHFSTADEAEPSYMHYQLVRFTQFVHMTRKLHMQVKYFHTANSGAIIQEPESHFNMVRPGLLLYGVAPSEHVKPPFDLEPVMDLKAPLVLVKELKRGMPVGYGRTYRAPQDTRMGVLQVGYADGLPVGLSGQGVVQLAGKVVPILGRVSMDMISVDLTDFGPGGELPQVGEQALIWGRSDDPRLGVEYQAGLAGTIPYELLVRLGRRVERVYVED